MKIKHRSLKSLRRKLWKIISEYVRREKANEKGFVKCYTCDTFRHYKDMDCGHYIHKDCLDFEINNLRPQCDRCNRRLSGNSGIFAERLIVEIGMEEVLGLRQRANVGYRFNIDELTDMISTYTQTLENLAK